MERQGVYCVVGTDFIYMKFMYQPQPPPVRTTVIQLTIIDICEANP